MKHSQTSLTTAATDTTAAKAASAPAPTNSSSRIRDHLANERTYLAWMRTAIALIGFGILIARLRYLISPDVAGTGHGWVLGMMLSCTGLLTVLLSTWHYFLVQEAIDNDTYKPSRRWILLFSTVVSLMGAGVLYVLLSMPTTVKGGLTF